MNWNKSHDDLPRDGRFILAVLWKYAGHPYYGVEERPVFLRWSGNRWVDTRWPNTKVRTGYGDSPIALWTEMEPPSQAEIGEHQMTTGFLGMPGLEKAERRW